MSLQINDLMRNTPARNSDFLKLHRDVTVTEIQDKGFLLRRSGDDTITKAGQIFATLLPLLKNGCDRSELALRLVRAGVDPATAEQQAQNISLQFEEAGLLQGSTCRVSQASRKHLTWESERLVSVINRIAPTVPMNSGSLAILGLLGTVVYIGLLWSLYQGSRMTGAIHFQNGWMPFVVFVLTVATWLFVHEIVHGIIAAKNGCRVKSIGVRLQHGAMFSIFPFCRLHEEDVIFNPRAHMRILIAGPAFDFAMAGIILLLFHFKPDMLLGIEYLFLVASTAIVVANTNLVTKSDVKDVFSSLRKLHGTSFTVINLARPTVAVLNSLLLVLLFAFLISAFFTF